MTLKCTLLHLLVVVGMNTGTYSIQEQDLSKGIITETENAMIERALIIKKEHLDKIFDDGKVWEMRTTKTSITGRIGLIESGTGLIIGEATLTGCVDYEIPKTKFFAQYQLRLKI